jgi:hypothetical protein
MRRRFADFSRPLPHTSAGEAIGVVLAALFGIVFVLAVIWGIAEQLGL